MPDRAEFLAVFERFAGHRPYTEQERAIFVDDGPRWILAGPGTGKTEVLVLSCAASLLLDRLQPGSVWSRRSRSVCCPQSSRPAVYLPHRSPRAAGIRGHQGPDIARLWLGKLHSVAHKMLLDMDDEIGELEMLAGTASVFGPQRTMMVRPSDKRGSRGR